MNSVADVAFDVLVITLSLADWISSIVVTVQFAKSNHFVFMSMMIIILVVDYIFGQYQLYHPGHIWSGPGRPRRYLYNLLIICPSLDCYSRKFCVKYDEELQYGTWNRHRHEISSKCTISKWMYSSNRFLIIFITQGLFSMIWTAVQLIAYEIHRDDTSDLLTVSIVIGICSICIRTLTLTPDLIIDVATLCLFGIASIADIILAFASISFQFLWITQMNHFCAVFWFISKIPIFCIATILCTALLHSELWRGIPSKWNNGWRQCIKWTVFPILLVPIGLIMWLLMICILEIPCFYLVALWLWYIGHSRLPNISGVHAFYRVIYQWAVLEAQSYSDGILGRISTNMAYKSMN